MSAKDNFAAKTSLAVSSIELTCCLFDEGQVMGQCQQENVWLFVHAIMMADGPPTGGYPKIGTVSSADLPQLAQSMPNKSRIRFRKTTVTKAQKRYRALMSGLNRIVEAE